MLPQIPIELWKKSSQWVALTRRHAEILDEDDLIVDIFANHCIARLHCIGDVLPSSL